MTIKILTRGKLPEEIVYKATCGNCKTHFEFNETDAKVTHDQRDGSFMTIRCPLCQKESYASWRNKQ